MKTIEAHWDPEGMMPPDADPQEEYDTYRDFAKRFHDLNGLTGEEFTVEDFKQYINGIEPL